MSTHKHSPKLLHIHSPFSSINPIFQQLPHQDFQLKEIVYSDEITKVIPQYAPDLIIFEMENMAKEECLLIKQLKEKTYTHSIPLLITTTPSNPEIFLDHLSDYGIDFIFTPYSLQEISLRIQRQLAHHRIELKRQKENRQLKTTLENRDKQYAVIAHDLRAPIGTIKMLNATVAPQIQRIDNRYILTLFNMIQTTTEEAFNLLENLLNWIQRQHGKTKISATIFDINQAIHQTISLFEAHLFQKKIVLQEHSKQKTEVYADADMVKTVLRNLIFNAIKFTYSGGKIDIITSNLSEYILVCVKDNGKGISPSELKRIKKSNTHLTTYGTHYERGSGLGLNISREFIRLNKGKFWISSQEGIGTTFFFTLPHPSADRQA